MLFLPPRRVAQPQEGTEPAWANPIARNLQFLWVPGTDRDLVKGTRSQTSGGSLPLRHSAHGLAAQGVNDGLYYFFGRQDIAPAGTNQFSMMVVANLADVASAFGHFIGRVWSNFVFYAFVDGVSDSRFWVGMAGNQTICYPATHVAGQLDPINGKDVVLIATWDGATVTLTVRELGGPWGGTRSVPKSGTFPADATASIRVLDRGDGHQKLNNAGVLAASAWHRPLRPAEVESLVQNPWQLFAPRQRRVWVPPSHSLVARHSAQRASATSGAAGHAHHLSPVHVAQAIHSPSRAALQVHQLAGPPAQQRARSTLRPFAQAHTLQGQAAAQLGASSTRAVQVLLALTPRHSAHTPASSLAAVAQRHTPGPRHTAQQPGSRSAAVAHTHLLQGTPSRLRAAVSRAPAQPFHAPRARRSATHHRCPVGTVPGFSASPSRYLVHVPVLPNRVEAPDHIEID
ncbi:hypothetical protein [Hydrogenophaga sp.]|uniref:hypothetical protein n=1 Tax=Hydrogenophaga sp. TaxID=1904254 RepID=UPI003F6FE7A0